MLKIEIKTNNSAYSNLSYEGRYALSEDLRKIAESIDMGVSCGVVMDINGNNVGEWVLK